jgi:PAS domain S-box-containing protein
MQAYLLPVWLILGWYLGFQYDKAKYYMKELEEILNNSDTMIWKNDFINKKLTVSKGMEEVTGYSQEDFSNNYYLFDEEITHPSDRKIAQSMYSELLSGNQSTKEWRIVNKSKKKVEWVLFRGSPILNKKGKVVKAVGIAIVNTKQKQIAEKLKESESRYRKLVEISPQMILIIQNEKIVYANPSTLKLTGVERRENLVGKTFYEFLDLNSQQKAKIRAKDILENKLINDYFEYEIQRIDGKKILVELLGTKINYRGYPAIMVFGKEI